MRLLLSYPGICVIRTLCTYSFEVRYSSCLGTRESHSQISREPESLDMRLPHAHVYTNLFAKLFMYMSSSCRYKCSFTGSNTVGGDCPVVRALDTSSTISFGICGTGQRRSLFPGHSHSSLHSPSLHPSPHSQSSILLPPPSTLLPPPFTICPPPSTSHLLQSS